MDSLEDFGVLVWALFGFACVLGPGEVMDYLTLRGQGYSSLSAAEAWALHDDDVVQTVGLFILIDAHLGYGQWIVQSLPWRL